MSRPNALSKHFSPAMVRAILRSSTNARKPHPPTRSMSAGPPRPYAFHVGASWAGKPGPAEPLQMPFPADSPIGAWRDRMLAWPKASKSTHIGQDFFFVQNGVSFGVADGVGGWIDSGIDPSLFSQALMYHAHRYSRNAWPGEPEIDPTLDYEEREEIEGWEMTPYECLDLAYGGVLREKFVQAGSSTACIMTMNASSGVFRSANLGDSGFMIIRSNSILHRQRPQTHFFNCPKQLTKLPANSGRKFSRACVDKPSEADTFRTKLTDGDIVIAYTDGLSDNVFASEIVTLCSLVARHGGTEEQQVQTIADRLVDFSRQCMRKKSRVSPFEKEAARHGMFFQGGKPDEYVFSTSRCFPVSYPRFRSVTVVVAMVRETS
ncbi:phosphatase 2C-like domain-containing protein [Lyophyllum atratum]|nr:phosphatase 2C-like domain-containing protein [Lyophyllum atratum]